MQEGRPAPSEDRGGMELGQLVDVGEFGGDLRQFDQLREGQPQRGEIRQPRRIAHKHDARKPPRGPVHRERPQEGMRQRQQTQRPQPGKHRRPNHMPSPPSPLPLPLVMLSSISVSAEMETSNPSESTSGRRRKTLRWMVPGMDETM